MIKENMKRILEDLPENVTLVGAAKTRSVDEINEAIDAGLTIVGHNYVQEAERIYERIEKKAELHLIGHLQSNKAKKAARIFDMIETLDSAKLARAIDNACRDINKIMRVLIEVNSGYEIQKAGVMPDKVIPLINEISELKNIRISGLMTMGPYDGDPEESRPCFRITKKLFDEIKALNLTGIEMRYLSMGMSDSYRIAIEEGANLVRLGTSIFGNRNYA